MTRIECSHCNTVLDGDLWDNPGWFNASYVVSLGRGAKNHAMQTRARTGNFCSTDCFVANLDTEILSAASSVLARNGNKLTKREYENLTAAVCEWCRDGDGSLQNPDGIWIHSWGDGEEGELCIAHFLHDAYKK